MKSPRESFALRRGLLSNMLAVTLLTAGMVGTVLLLGAYRAVDALSDRAIEQAIDTTGAELAGFFEPIEAHVKILRELGEAGEYSLEYDDLERMNRRLMPVLRNVPQATSVLVADSGGREVLLLQQGDEGWVNRVVDQEALPGMARWVERDAAGEAVERRQEETDYRTGERPWFRGAMSAGAGGQYWTAPYTFFTTGDPGITVSTSFEEPTTGRRCVVALDILLMDVSTFTAGLRPTENGSVTVLTTTGRVVGLPATGQENPARSELRERVLLPWDELGLPVAGRGLQLARDRGGGKAFFSGSDDELGAYRAGYQTFPLGEQALTMVTVLPWKDLAGAVDRQRDLTFGLSLLAIIVALGLGLRTSRRVNQRIEEIVREAEEVGPYRLQEKIGAGGMGEVYRAEHALLQRPTAVKFIHPDIADEEALQRFEREVQMTCQLTHPNTVTIFDYGKTDDGVFYYAMELIPGVTLQELVDFTGPLPEGRVIYLLRQIAGALQEAHEVGLVHRDVKPGNIMVGRRGGEADFITVLDFGLVKDIHAPDEMQLTDEHAMQGSPGFMAPEVILGTKQTLSVDIFALGAVGYQLLTGRPPFHGENAMKVMLAQVNHTPESPSVVLGRSVSPDLESLLMACLEKSPVNRPSTVRVVKERLRRCRAVSQWGEEEALRWWERYGKDLVSEPARTGVEEMSGPTVTAPRPTLEYTTRHDSSPDG